MAEWVVFAGQDLVDHLVREGGGERHVPAVTPAVPDEKGSQADQDRQDQNDADADRDQLLVGDAAQAGVPGHVGAHVSSALPVSAPVAASWW
ncbi:hypothetical protein [Melissospora conviva]|uniref:hypothetical protein n=1 Tax=Melissospora conviva TaxID=3388432 RepID=UPI003B77CE1E